LKLTFDDFRNWFLYWDLWKLNFEEFFNMFDYCFDQLFFNGWFFCGRNLESVVEIVIRI
jgi:hypothetical protein